MSGTSLNFAFCSPAPRSPNHGFVRQGEYSPGFTLVEMLAVMGIIGLMLALALPKINGVLEGVQVGQAAQLVSGELGLARQVSLSRNHCVEVRFYQYANPAVAGETANQPSTGKYRALQLFDVQETGATVPLDRVQSLPGLMMMDSGSSLSSLIGMAAANSATAPILTTGSTLEVSIPAAGLQYNAVTFQFRPDGSTNLPSGAAAPWFLTLHNLRFGDQKSTPPANFFTLQVNASNGHTNSYRP